MRVMGDRILCTRAKEAVTRGGIILTNVVTSNRYKVVSVGDEVDNLEAGDNVIITTQGTKIIIDGVDHYIFKFQQIELVYQDEEQEQLSTN